MRTDGLCSAPTFRNIWFVEEDIEDITRDSTNTAWSLGPSWKGRPTSLGQRRCTWARNSGQSDIFRRLLHPRLTTVNIPLHPHWGLFYLQQPKHTLLLWPIFSTMRVSQYQKMKKKPSSSGFLIAQDRESHQQTLPGVVKLNTCNQWPSRHHNWTRKKIQQMFWNDPIKSPKAHCYTNQSGSTLCESI